MGFVPVTRRIAQNWLMKLKNGTEVDEDQPMAFLKKPTIY